MNCKTCKYWSKSDRKLDAHGRANDKEGTAEMVGECRPTRPDPATSSAGAWRAFPVTRESDWCGQHQVGTPTVKVEIAAKETAIAKENPPAIIIEPPASALKKKR